MELIIRKGGGELANNRLDNNFEIKLTPIGASLVSSTGCLIYQGERKKESVREKERKRIYEIETF